MEKDADYIRLVKKAQLGDRSSLERLSKEARRRLQVDVFRLTLKDDLTGDIVQETILEMLKILSELREADRFWPWLYKIALNKLRLHHRKQQRRNTTPISAIPDGAELKDSRDAMSDAVGRELKEIVLKAMGRLRPNHRAVLTMRCYREMEYSLIAETLGCSEFAAKMQFYRAKRALRKQLARAGLGKGSLLLALIVFGKMTAPAEAAGITVTAGATKVGAAVAVVGALGGKTAIVTLATAGIVGAGALVATSGPEGTTAKPDQIPAMGSPNAGHVEKVHEEYWYYFPQGPDGPMMTRLMKGDSAGKGYQCVQMHDETGSYYLDRRKSIVRIENYRSWHEDLSVWRLPTDKTPLTKFISQTEGKADNLEYVRADGPGLMVVVERSGDGGSTWTTRHRHVLKEEYFRFSRPADAKVIDNRDPMHYRGWTYFTVKGRIGGESVSGTGRIPFVYAAGAEHSPWLKLSIGDRLELIDDGRQAIVRRQGKVVASYPGGSFFAGLSRPWMGLHTLDSVRRDAAERQVPFETSYDAQEKKAEVVLTSEQGKLLYTIDMEKDVVENIRISTGGAETELRFDYLQDIRQAGRQSSEPQISSRYGSFRRKSPGMLWLMELAARPAERWK
jgi:RNA polymerase sigma-70 factor (ECF subfamily)